MISTTTYSDVLKAKLAYKNILHFDTEGVAAFILYSPDGADDEFPARFGENNAKRIFPWDIYIGTSYKQLFF